MRGWLIALMAVLLASCGGSATESDTTLASTVPTVHTLPSKPSTTEPPGGRSPDLFCQMPGPYYVQVSFLTVPGQGMCTASQLDYTQEEFQAIPGLKRRCILDRDEQLKQKHAMVSIYSDGTPESIDSARTICASTGNDFTE